MPSEQEHLNQARHNETFIQRLLQGTRYMDWAVTGLFYTALHYIEAFLATQGVHSPTHRSRDTVFSRFPQLTLIYDPYRKLKDASLRARYLAQGPRAFSTGSVHTLLSNELAHIKRHLGY